MDAAPPTVEHTWVLDAARREVAVHQLLDKLIAAAATSLPKLLQPTADEEFKGLKQLNWQLDFVSKGEFGVSSMHELLLQPSGICESSTALMIA
jgi:hypothetical protein